MSLASRLSGFFLIALALVLGGFSVTLFLLYRAHFEADLDERLGLALDALTPAVEIDPGRIQWKPINAPSVEDTHSIGDRIHWCVFNDAANVIEKSWDLNRADFQKIFDESPRSGHIHTSFNDHNGANWRLALRRVSAPPPIPRQDEERDEEDGHSLRVAPENAAQSIVLATGVSLRATEAGQRNVVITLTGLSFAIWTAAAIVGRRLCRRALLPVTQMATAACTMGAADRDHRLPSPGTRDELDALANSFNGLLDRLHQALDRQTRFTGDASHQLRTPLAGLLGQIEVTRRRDRSPEDYKLALDQIHSEATRLRQIVDSLLFMARAENDAAKPDLQPIRLDSWLRNHLENDNSHPRLAEIETHIPPHPVWVRVHPPLLAQLVDNLLDNAFKYSPPNARITIRIETPSGKVRLAIEDQGFGIAHEDLNSIFDPFFRSAEARRRGQPGVGLGLSVVKRIVEVFGGTIQADSQPGQGSRFILELPELSPTDERHELRSNVADCLRSAHAP
jgi:two-component system, OmpR family, sensor kinase